MSKDLSCRYMSSEGMITRTNRYINNNFVERGHHVTVENGSIVRGEEEHYAPSSRLVKHHTSTQTRMYGDAHADTQPRSSRHSSRGDNTKSKRQLLLSMSHNKCTNICTLILAVSSPNFSSLSASLCFERK